MNLFNNEKEIINKITNAVLLIWFVAAIVIVCGSIINLVLRQPTQSYTYKEYQTANCAYYKNDTLLTETEITERCKNDYNNYKFNTKNDEYYKLVTLYTSFANAIVVGGVIYFLNREVKTKKR